MKKYLGLFFSFALVVAIVFSSDNVYANSLQRTHAVVSFAQSGNLQGAYMYSTVPDLTSNWSTTNNDRFILKTQWININGNGSWIENGYFEGASYNGNYHDGFYMAYGIMNSSGQLTSYQENLISGPSKTVGSGHHHHTKYIGNNYWRSTIDNSYSWDVYGWYGGGTHDVGIEANNSSSTLNHTNTNMTSANMQYYNGTEWKDWTTAATTQIIDPFNIGVKIYQSPSETSAGFYK